MKRKIIISSLIGLIIIIVSLVVYSSALKKQQRTNGNNSATGADLFPFGTPNTGGNFATSTQNLRPEIPPAENVGSRLIKISDGPVSGFGFVKIDSGLTIATTTNGSSTKPLSNQYKIVFNNRADSHVFEFNPITLSVTRISNTTIPQATESFWSPSGNRVAIRYADENSDTNTIAANLTNSFLPGSEQKTLSGPKLQTNIRSLKFSTDGESLFYTTNGSQPSAWTLNLGSGVTKQSNLGPIGEWVADWFSGTTAGLQTSASNFAEGFYYWFNTNNGRLTQVLGPKTGLEAKANYSGTKLFYTDIDQNNNAGSGFYDIKTKTDFRFGEGIAKLAEKCAWLHNNDELLCGSPISTPGAFIDNWYQGVVSFSDDVVFISTKAPAAGNVLFTEDLSEPLDVFMPGVSPDDNYFVFINKRDLSLWAVNINKFLEEQSTL